ncbi:hypothetical protein PR048_007864 [Dryococelus australis]|uniref:Uncharacterized protein n=1 Tax=Dryococelus australis TaxID=614101 RepID=A0ABQ9HVG7_9NEOP|nr:hypothetical protein PR048_007864 [Dryococelus australis]
MKGSCLLASNTKANWVQSPAGSLPNFHAWESCRTILSVGGFSQGYPLSPHSHSGTAPYSPQSPSSTLKTSLLRAAQISSLTQSVPGSLLPTPAAQPIGEISQYAVANHAQDTFSEPRTANQNLGTPTSREPPRTSPAGHEDHSLQQVFKFTSSIFDAGETTLHEAVPHSANTPHAIYCASVERTFPATSALLRVRGVFADSWHRGLALDRHAIFSNPGDGMNKVYVAWREEMGKGSEGKILLLLIGVHTRVNPPPAPRRANRRLCCSPGIHRCIMHGVV